MEAIIKATRDGRLEKIKPALVISSDSSAPGVAKALRLGIKKEDIVILKPKDFNTREEFGEKILLECKKRNIHLIGQYGWHYLTPKNVVEAFERKMINQHPGPLDTGRLDFGGAGMFGLRVHETRLQFVRRVGRDYWTEATAHFVTPEFDKGSIVKRRAVEIFPEDTAETLQKRTLPAEHEVQIEALEDFSNNNVSIFTRKTPLVFPGEEKILEECKTLAKEKYPKG